MQTAGGLSGSVWLLTLGYGSFGDSGDWPRIASSACLRVCDMLTASRGGPT